MPEYTASAIKRALDSVAPNTDQDVAGVLASPDLCRQVLLYLDGEDAVKRKDPTFLKRYQNKVRRLLLEHKLINEQKEVVNEADSDVQPPHTPKADETEVTVAKEKTKTKTKRTAGELSPTVSKIVNMLQRAKGATRKQLEEGNPEAKPAYINALVHRVLKEKGYKVTSARPEGSKEVVYSIAA